MEIPSVLFSFLEAALKRRSTTAVAEIKGVMSAHLKTPLAVHGGGRMMVDKMIDWETLVPLLTQSNARVGLQRIIFF